MAKDKLISPSFCYILAANFLLFFAFYLILPILIVPLFVFALKLTTAPLSA